ncbi:DUF4232 domain-containing protein [Actinospica robiniae]|uniref:DUF4232 domain-containing protein n=1 Tax=Actinospica robiniae TaxID=304901 RepID=UPI000429DF12|nr:DUF4232 domain-containing protein [Actinospica robiniae]
MTMSRGQFIAVTAVLAAAVMAGSGYLAYASVGGSSTPPQSLPPATGSSATASADGSPVTVPTLTATVGASASASPSAAASASASASAPAAPGCGDDAITVSLGQGQGAAGHVSVLLLFTNSSGQTCTLQGYPGAELVDPSGTLKPLDAVRKLTGNMGGAVGLAKPPLVTLAVGQTVSAVLEWSDVPSGDSSASCYTSADTLEATPPNSKRSTTLALGSSATVCGAFQVHPVLPLIGNAPAS